MGKYLNYHDEGYVEVTHSDYSIAAAFQYTNEAAELTTRIPPPPEGYHVLEDLTGAKSITPAAMLIVRELLVRTPLHCCAIFGGTPEITADRMEEAKASHKESIHHVFKTREEAVSWLMENHNFSSNRTAPLN